MADIDVVIVNYNAGPFLLKAVDSVAQDSRVHRIIVVDNASRDTSMREFCARAAGEPRMIPLQNDRNLGFARACNIGIKAAAGDYLLFLNPDGEVQPGALETMVSAMRINDQVGMAGPLVLNPDGTEQAGSRRAVPTPWRTFVRAFGLSRYSNRYPKLFPDFHLNEGPLPDGPQEVEAISGSCMMVKRSALEKVGPLDEKYFLHCEDLDWCMRFRQCGLQILFVPEARVMHQRGVCGKNRTLFVEWHKHKGMIRFYRKFFYHQYPGILFLIVCAGVWLRFGLLAVGSFCRSLLPGKSQAGNNGSSKN